MWNNVTQLVIYGLIYVYPKISPLHNFMVQSISSDVATAHLVIKLSAPYRNRMLINVFKELTRTSPQQINPVHIRINMKIILPSTGRSFPSGFLSLSYAFLIAVMHATCMAQLILLFITLVNSRCHADNRWIFYSSPQSCCISLSSPNILLRCIVSTPSISVLSTKCSISIKFKFHRHIQQPVQFLSSTF